MPEISRFNGIVIQMYRDDHRWPHFHARYAEYQASSDIQTMRVTKGRLPSRIQRAVVRWANPRKSQLLANWELIENGEDPRTLT